MANKDMVGNATYKDKKGKAIKTGSIVALGRKRGIVLNDEFEGQYVSLKGGLNLRVKDYFSKLKVVNPGISKEVQGGVIRDGKRKF
ncbi:MAG: hypothetical protein RR627_11245 [Niameybacter sp.]